MTKCGNKRCRHEECYHHAVTGKCEASIIKSVSDWNTVLQEDGSIRWKEGRVEYSGECQCLHFVSQ